MRRMKLMKVRANRPFGGMVQVNQNPSLLAMDSHIVFNATIDAQCAKISLIIVSIFFVSHNDFWPFQFVQRQRQ